MGDESGAAVPSAKFWRLALLVILLGGFWVYLLPSDDGNYSTGAAVGPGAKMNHQDSQETAFTAQQMADAKELTRLFMERRSGVQGCYESALRYNSELAGTVELMVEVDGTGKLLLSKIEKNTLSDPAVGNCIMRRINQWKFPPSVSGNVAVIVPFHFKKAK